MKEMEGGSDIQDLLRRMQEEPDDNCSSVINDFKRIDPIRKEMLVNMIQVIVKLGKLQEASDQEKRERWSNRRNNTFNS